MRTLTCPSHSSIDRVKARAPKSQLMCAIPLFWTPLFLVSQLLTNAAEWSYIRFTHYTAVSVSSSRREQTLDYWMYTVRTGQLETVREVLLCTLSKMYSSPNRGTVGWIGKISPHIPMVGIAPVLDQADSPSSVDFKQPVSIEISSCLCPQIIRFLTMSPNKTSATVSAMKRPIAALPSENLYIGSCTDKRWFLTFTNCHISVINM